jgi:hypothetical protein
LLRGRQAVLPVKKLLRGPDAFNPVSAVFLAAFAVWMLERLLERPVPAAFSLARPPAAVCVASLGFAFLHSGLVLDVYNWFGIREFSLSCFLRGLRVHG